MYIVENSKGNRVYCFTIEEAIEKYYEFLNSCEFVQLLKLLPGNATEQIRTSW